MNGQGAEFVEIFLQEASERLQFLREYSGILQDGYPRQEDVERLHIAAHTLAGTSASYGFPLFAEISGKLAHIFQYALNATIAADAAGPLVEFISEAVALLESDLIMISTNAVESEEDIGVFKQRYPFAFQTSAVPQQEERSQTMSAADTAGNAEKSDAVLEASSPIVEVPYQPLPADGEVPAEVLEFFVPEAEEHLQIVTHCLLSLETNPSSEQIHRLLRAMHTVKGSAAQVGLHRISHVAHRAEDLIGRLREGELRPSAEIIDICLDAVDTLKKFLYHQWTDEAAMQSSVQGLFSRISRLVPPEKEEEFVAPTAAPAREAASPAYASQNETVTTSYLQEIHLSEDEPASAEPAAIAHREPSAAVPVLAPTATAEIRKPEGIEKFADEDLMRKEPASMPQSKSVRIALERLDRMMNAVGELVINRTRMLGRVAELERLADVLNFSKARMQDKVSEFQEKHEFSRIHSAPTPRPADDFPLRSDWKWTAMTISISSLARSQKFPPTSQKC